MVGWLHRHKTGTFVLSGAGLAVAAVLCVVFYFTVFVVPVVAGGRSISVPSGTTVGDVISRGLVQGHRGDVVAVRSRSVEATGRGGAAIVLVNGKPAAANQRLKRGDVVTTRKGPDVVEPLRTRTETITPQVEYEGFGPVRTVLTAGTPGSRRVTYGSLSGQIVTRHTTLAPVPRVVLRTRPSSGKKVIALTFDDGPWRGQSAAILKILLANHVRATFFEIGRQARAHPAWSRMLAKAGMLIGNHSETHPLNAKKLSAAKISWQITQAETDITAASGTRPLLFRPPGGTVVPAMKPVLAKLGMRLVQWDIDTNDWKRPPTTSIINTVLKHARNGAVVLMHDGGGDRRHTIAALPVILRALKAEGYTLVTLDQLKSLPQVMH